MSFGSLSYRNGKYQGLIHNGQRHGLGILIDDDLTFHASHWHQNKMQGPTLVYLAHAKYIYGEWKNNQPHGLNVYRSGDTVLLSKYVFGVPSNRCLLIFQRHGFACVLGEANKQWQVIKSGQLTNHSSLMKFIQLLQVDVPEHYLSLIKFSCAFSSYHNSIKTFPCFQNYCYFGYINGLAIVFNSNNGLVAVGQHKNQQLCEFGGKFKSKRAAQEGNFATGETVQYKGERPIQRIYQIYQRIHRKDNNFVNEVYQSKTKIFNSIQSLIINKFKTIVQDSKKESVQRFDLNESLDYQEYNQEESFKLEEIRDRMYSPPKKTFEKIKEQSTPIKKEVLPPQGQSLLKSLRKPVMNEIESSTKNKEEKEVRRGYQQEKQQRSIGLALQANTTPNRENNEPSQFSQPPKFARINSLISSFTHKKTQSAAISHSFLKENPNPRTDLQQQNTKAKFYNNSPTSYFNEDSNRLEETSSFKKIVEQDQLLKQSGKLLEESSKQRPTLQRKRSIDQFTRPTYEDIEQRRKRILRDFEELNSQSPNKIAKSDKKAINDSPYRQDLISIQQQDQSSFGYIPLSISNKVNQKKDKSTTKTRIQQKPPQQQNSESYQRSQEKSSKRRINYNYSNLDSRSLNSETKECSTSQAKPQEGPSPIRPKRAYQYMYE